MKKKTIPLLPWQPAGHRFFSFLCTGQAPANLSPFFGLGDGEMCSDSFFSSSLRTFSFFPLFLEDGGGEFFFFLGDDFSTQLGQNQFPLGIKLKGGSRQ